jgi:hypothetical protein
MSHVLTDRDDQLGSNFLPRISDYIFSKYHKIQLYRSPRFRYPNSIYNYPFIKYSICNNDVKSSHPYFGGVCGRQATSVMLIKQDLISHFNENYKEDFYKLICEKAPQNWKLPWEKDEKVIVFHLRLSDGRHRGYNGGDYKDYNGKGAALYFKDLIENEKFNQYSKEKMNNYSGSHGYSWGNLRHANAQCCMSLDKLENMIKDFKIKYPEKRIFVVTKLGHNKNVNKKLKSICNNNDVNILSNGSEDFDLWCMIHSDVLVFSKSSYPLIAGYFHQGSHVYYQYWGVFACAGLGTKYDKSNWIAFE